MRFLMEIESDNDALVNEDWRAELARIITQVAREIADDMVGSHLELVDSNGNRVGHVRIWK